MALGSASFVALAGFIAMRRKLGPMAVAATVFAASLLSAAISALILSMAPSSPEATKGRFYIVIVLWSAFWWCLGMLAFYDHDIFHAGPELTLTTEERKKLRLPNPVWAACGMILVGLIVAAYKFRPQ